uniref:Movement protein TGB2 n=1 Tax=Peony betaflexivirus 1 TaxID=2800951 RepID=A0A7L7QTM5_9VIRU|nr:TGB2 [Peony betaflexivirus 1]
MLAPPPDYSKLGLPLIIGAATALSLFFLTRSNLPHVGDNVHSLPHGGRYKDGTKSVDYCSPRKNLPSSNLFEGKPWNILLLILALSYAIYIISSRDNRRPCVVRGCVDHP